MTSPLSHIKVVEISVAMAGPSCGMMLADYGAGVVTVERVGSSDDSRGWPPYFHGAMSHYFASANRNKRSIALDLKDPEEMAVVRHLAATADVLIETTASARWPGRAWTTRRWRQRTRGWRRPACRARG